MTPSKIVLALSLICNVGMITLYTGKSSEKGIHKEANQIESFSKKADTELMKNDRNTNFTETDREELVNTETSVDTLIENLKISVGARDQVSFINRMIDMEENIELMGAEEVALEIVDRYEQASADKEKMDLLALLNLAQSRKATDFFLSIIDSETDKYGFEKRLASDMLSNSEYAASNIEIREKVIERLYTVEDNIDKVNYVKVLRNHENLSTEDIRYSREIVEPLLSDTDQFVRSEAVKTLSSLAQNHIEFNEFIGRSLRDESSQIVHTSLNIISDRMIDQTENGQEPYRLDDSVRSSLLAIANNHDADLTMRYTALGTLAMSDNIEQAESNAKLYSAYSE